ncbi:MAG: SsrA-binding protein SmpB [Ruminococcaceae bacterium]|nr:SsrA-binding protein SmpB [Oscillospiraceae bacterium]
MVKTSMKILSENRKARHDYFIEETFEAGISLCGTEVKSMRKGAVNLKDSFVSFRNGEAFIKNMHISPYEQGNIFNRDPLRDRRLLLHKREINYLFGAVKQKGFSVIPLSVYLKDSLVKVQIGLARGKKLYDKRSDIAERDAKRRMDREVKERNQ